MSKIEGAELYRHKEIPEPNATVEDIILNIRTAYQEADIIHADLSPYNIILEPDSHILIIDWPQYVTHEHPNADQLLRRDIRNVLKFFKSKYEIEASLEQAFSVVTQPNTSVS
jgi:RIO kinase 2